WPRCVPPPPECRSVLFLFLRATTSPPFPYTTLFRSAPGCPGSVRRSSRTSRSGRWSDRRSSPSCGPARPTAARGRPTSPRRPRDRRRSAAQSDLVAAELLTDAGEGREDGVDRERADHRQRGEGQGEAGSGAGLPRLRYMRGGEGGGHRRKPKLVNPPAAPSSALREAIARRC